MGGESGSGLKGINNTREQSLIPYETMAKSNEGILSGVREAKSGIRSRGESGSGLKGIDNTRDHDTIRNHGHMQ